MASRGACPLRAALIEVCEELRLRVAGDRDGRAARLDEVVDERERPRGLQSSESSGACSTRARLRWSSR